MSRMVRDAVRWLLAMVLVSLPVSYILWQWRYAEHKELSGLSYEAFNRRLSAAEPPVLWTYAIYVTLLIVVVLCLVALVARGLALLFPQPRKLAPGKR